MYKTVDHSSKAKRVRSQSKKKRQDPRLVQREKLWNGRIIAGEHILTEQRRGSAMLGQRQKHSMFPEISSTNQIVNRYVQMHKEQVQKENRQESELKNIQIRLEQVKSLWRVFNVPQIHQHAFDEMISQSKSQVKLLDEEIRLLDAKLSPVQHCVYALTAREKCFRVLDALIQQGCENQEERCSELLEHLRLLTVLAFEGVIKWQQHFEERSRGWKIEFKSDEGRTLTEDVLQTYQYLKQSGLRKVWEFREEADPFLMALIPEKERNTAKTKQLLVRIRRVEVEMLVWQLKNRVSDQQRLEQLEETERLIQKELNTDGYGIFLSAQHEPNLGNE